ncbi:VOC family protein [uncultured Secundilactobacillus sp.]|uniref:VOC family protein n=1 Tax=uncultured Secundilactobacillus sp. TaxID=2813935 RepID=UPI00258E7A75|nr:VOC family protein [uncultured Secundilactobacillus sp.]
MNIKSIDSITIIVSDIARAVRFYHEVFDLPLVNGSKTTLQVGGKQQLQFVTPAATGIHISEEPGNSELALATKDPLAKTLAHLTNYAVEIDDGPVPYQGATGPATALWLRDPDHNLIKLVCY